MGTNRYAYSFNDPVNLSDPRGHETKPWFQNQHNQSIWRWVFGSASTQVSNGSQHAVEQAQTAAIEYGPALANFAADMTPVLGDIKGFFEATTALDYVFAVAAVVPGIGDFVGKSRRGALAADAAQAVAQTGESTTLFRATSAEEYTDIMSTGSFRLPPGGMECKQFGCSLSETLDFTNTRIGQNAAGIVGVDVPTSLLDRLGHGVQVDPFIFKSGTVTIDRMNLDYFNSIIGAPFDALD